MDKNKNKKHRKKNDLPKAIPKSLRRQVRDLLKWADIDDAFLISNRALELVEAKERAEKRDKQGLSYIA